MSAVTADRGATEQTDQNIFRLLMFICSCFVRAGGGDGDRLVMRSLKISGRLRRVLTKQTSTAEGTMTAEVLLTIRNEKVKDSVLRKIVAR